MFKDERVKKLQAVRLTAFFVVGFVLFMTLNSFVTSVVDSAVAQRRTQNRSRKVAQPAPRKKPQVDYSQFSHQTHVAQQKLSCDSCHKFPTKNWKEVRKGDAAFADVAEFPEHSSCLECHRQQFFARERPAPRICSNCHVNVTPRDTTRFLFPSLGDVADPSRPWRDAVTEFGINFPHDKHIDVVGLNVPAVNPRQSAGIVSISWQEKTAPKASSPKKLPLCHETYLPQGKSSEEFVTKPPKDVGDNFWLKKGTFKTIPNSHTGCFTCHSVDSGIAPAPAECSTCHKLAALQTVPKTDFDPKLAETMGVKDKTVLNAWHKRISSGAFRHEGGEHPDVSCTNCHNVPTMVTTDPRSTIVPIASCGGAEGCHITAKTDDGGILNYEIDQKKTKPSFVCTKCHISFGNGPVPESHIRAIPPTVKVGQLQNGERSDPALDGEISIPTPTPY